MLCLVLLTNVVCVLYVADTDDGNVRCMASDQPWPQETHHGLQQASQMLLPTMQQLLLLQTQPSAPRDHQTWPPAQKPPQVELWSSV